MTQRDRDAPEPCPFCGGEASLYSVSMPMRADCADIHVACIDCDAIGPSILYDQTSHTEDDIPDLEVEAISAWNRRLVREDVRPEGASAGGEDYCEQCHDSGYVCENGAQEYCDCVCGQDARDQADQKGLHALSTPSPAPACVTPDIHTDACVTSEAVSRYTKAMNDSARG